MPRMLAALGLLVVLIAGCGIAPELTAVPGSADPGATPGTSVPIPSSPSDPSAASAPPAATPVPWTSDVGALAWHRLGRIPADVIDVVGFDDGYVALSQSGRHVFFSPDGRGWQRVRLPLDPPGGGRSVGPDANGRFGRALATQGASVLVVGGYSHAPCETAAPGDTGYGPLCDYSPVTWISDDGVHWQAAFPDVTAEFVAAWPAGASGWQAAASTWAGVTLGGRQLWASDDGIEWSRLKPRPPIGWEGYDPDVPTGLAGDSPARTLIAASERSAHETTVAWRTDGSWQVLDRFPSEGALVITGLAPVGEGTPWVLAGLTYDESGCNPERDGDGCGVESPTIWSSTDGTTWTTSRLKAGSGIPASEPDDLPIRVTAVSSLVDSDRGYVAVGADSGEEGARHETWVSDDGARWRRLPQPERATFDLGPGLVAAGPAGVIGISATRSGRDATAWELR